MSRSQRGRPTESFFDRIDSFAEYLRGHQTCKDFSSHLLIMSIAFVLTIIERIIFWAEMGAVSSNSKRTRIKFNSGFISNPAGTSTTLSTTDGRTSHSFQAGLAARGCPHLVGRFPGLDRDLIVLVDPGSEGTFIHKSAVPTGHPLFDLYNLNVSGVSGDSMDINHGLVIDLEIPGCKGASMLQRGTGSGAELCSKMLQMGTEPGLGSFSSHVDLVAPKIKLTSYVAPDHNGGVDVLIGTNVLCQYNAALAMGRHGTLTIDADLGAGATRVEVPLDWKFTAELIRVQPRR